jgi:hypothetical protein
VEANGTAGSFRFADLKADMLNPSGDIATAWKSVNGIGIKDALPCGNLARARRASASCWRFLHRFVKGIPLHMGTSSYRSPAGVSCADGGG